MATEMLESLKALARHLYRGVHWEKFPDGPRCVREPLKIQHLQMHLTGGRGIGCAPITPGESTTRAALFDLDDHSGTLGWDGVATAARLVLDKLPGICAPRCVRSSGGKGIHIYLLWEQPQDAYSVREMMRETLEHAGYKSGVKGVDKGEIEIFPKQDEVKPDGVGSMWVLPFSRESLPLNEQLDPMDMGLASLPGWWLHSEPVPVRERPKPATNTEPDSVDVEKVAAALAAIPNDDLDYDEWRNIIFALHHATGGSARGLQLAHQFSSRSPKYDAAFLDNRVWTYINHERGGAVVTSASLFAKAREHGFVDDGGAMDAFTEFAQSIHIQNTEESKPESLQQPAISPASRFKVHSISELAGRPDPKWMIENVLPRAALIVLYGESTAGKSFVALDIAYAIAAGIEWRGREVKQGRVVYVCAEGMGGFTLRMRAISTTHGDTHPLGTITDTPNFLLVDDVRDVIKAVQTYGKTDLVIVDTLAQVSPGGNENSAEDMGKVLEHCKAINRCTGATVMLVHHAGKDLSRGARGWSGLKAAADAEIEITRDDNRRAIRLSKLKDGEDGQVMEFRLKNVTVGMDERSNPIESCIIEHIYEQVGPRAPAFKNEWQAAAYRLALEGQTMGSEGIARKDFVARVLADRGVTEPTFREREKVARALLQLEQRGLLSTRDGRISLITKQACDDAAMQQAADVSDLF